MQAVNAYANIHQWVDIRKPVTESEIPEIAWTDEDEVLPIDSMRDLDLESA